jgi:nicotinate-nucleotide pyrophosphorylase (carboxylating)
MSGCDDQRIDARTLSLIGSAVAEDVGSGDVTSEALVPPEAVAGASVITRCDCVVCGTSVASGVFTAVDPGIESTAAIPDGHRALAGEVLMRVRGPARSILTAERTALNFMQRLCGIATLTARFVDAVAGTHAVIMDTRKTTPGFRQLEKYAVRCGGGVNHRFGLYDRVLIKDNHRKLWGVAGRDLGAAVTEARRRFPSLAIQIEVECVEELRSALVGKPDWVLLDNMPAGLMRECVGLCSGRCRTEASGGINLSNVRAIAETGVDAISLGCLTHSAPAVDLSLEVRTP